MTAPRFSTFLLALGLLSAATAAEAQTTKKTTTTAKKTTTTAKKTTPAKKTTTTKPATKTTTTTTKTTTAPVVATPPPLTADEATAAVKEALNLSVTRALEAGAQADAFNGNPDIRLAFPPEAELVNTTLRGLRMGAVIDKFEVQMNRAAEAVAANPQAQTILAAAAQRYAIADGLALVNTRESRLIASQFKTQQLAQVQQELRPLVDAALEQTGAKQAYGELMLRYKKVPLVTPIATNLTDYSTGKIAEGLFTLIADEESRIRLNSSARSTTTLQRAFGQQ
ncbi:DUF4197 domain-containing protein [Hymenobacter sp. 15J16-1T3B]|uniref:DUF4197 domain-containing protein n=1 Tax=Hymenobacter sp. 15J16-1T3B TaxID=2886941 RepID=UPI001D12AC9A|nr:DUF4197 domain-containing protein [Hymenobacter sp. 15J16-1T3B]MCC3156945.1 DUF4197 domain-containing protein [Hymenobacter sp. 15J16-1T3B]